MTSMDAPAMQSASAMQTRTSSLPNSAGRSRMVLSPEAAKVVVAASAWKKLTNWDVSQIKVFRPDPDQMNVPGRVGRLRNRRGCGIMRA